MTTNATVTFSRAALAVAATIAAAEHQGSLLPPWRTRELTLQRGCLLIVLIFLQFLTLTLNVCDFVILGSRQRSRNGLLYGKQSRVDGQTHTRFFRFVMLLLLFMLVVFLRDGHGGCQQVVPPLHHRRLSVGAGAVARVEVDI